MVEGLGRGRLAQQGTQGRLEARGGLLRAQGMRRVLVGVVGEGREARGLRPVQGLSHWTDTDPREQ